MRHKGAANLKTNLPAGESTAGCILLSALTLPSALAYPGREASPFSVLPMGHEHIQFGDEDAAGEIRRAVSIEKWGWKPDCTRMKERVGGEEVAAVTS